MKDEGEHVGTILRMRLGTCGTVRKYVMSGMGSTDTRGYTCLLCWTSGCFVWLIQWLMVWLNVRYVNIGERCDVRGVYQERCEGVYQERCEGSVSREV